MDILFLCNAIKSILPILKDSRTGKVIDHSLVEQFQKDLKDQMNNCSTEYCWEIEQKAKGRSEKDSIDILGKAKGLPNWIIEIDATRSDQVSQKLLSRIALWGLKEPIKYIAILYPDTTNGKNACEKYLRYGNEIIRKINKNSSVCGIFIDPQANTVELLQFGKSTHFEVNGKECKSMSEAASVAIKEYLVQNPSSFTRLQNSWGRFVLDTRGPSRYKNTRLKTTDGITVHTFTQFRQYGLCSYWSEFEKLCKKNGIIITKVKKIF